MDQDRRANRAATGGVDGRDREEGCRTARRARRRRSRYRAITTPAVDLIGRNLKPGRIAKIAYIDDRGAYSYWRVGRARRPRRQRLRALGLEPEQRVLLCLLDSIDFPTLFLGAIKAGIVPIAANTLLTRGRLRFHAARPAVLRAPRGPANALYERFAPILPRQPALKQVVVSGSQKIDGRHFLPDLLAAASPKPRRRSTQRRRRLLLGFIPRARPAAPKGVVHLHSHRILTGRAVRQADPRQSPRATSSSPPRSCSSPMGSATP